MKGNHQVNMDKWQKMTIFDQMGNIGSEVGRTYIAMKNGDKASETAAYYRGLDLLDATAQVWADKRSPRTREILRAREEFVGSVISQKPDASLENYFMQFAIASRLSR